MNEIELLRPRGVPRGTVKGALASIAKQLNKSRSKSTPAVSPVPVLGQERPARIPRAKPDAETLRRREAIGWAIVGSQISATTRVWRLK